MVTIYIISVWVCSVKGCDDRVNEAIKIKRRGAMLLRLKLGCNAGAFEYSSSSQLENS